MPKIVADKMDWVKQGFKLFAQLGMGGIVVDKMANTLKCNRSSFYWHFNSKEVFVYEIIKYWIELDTTDIIELTQKINSPEEKFRQLVTLVFKKDPHIDFIFHLKRYALKRNDIQNIIDEIDAQRINFVFSTLKEMGHSDAEASSKAQIFYKYLIGYHEMLKGKMQGENYVEEVYNELKHFITL